jgi:hypothetical protein
MHASCGFAVAKGRFVQCPLLAVWHGLLGRREIGVHSTCRFRSVAGHAIVPVCYCSGWMCVLTVDMSKGWAF